MKHFDGSGNVKVDEFTAATTWSNLGSYAKAFTAGDALDVRLSGTAFRVYHVANPGTASEVITLLGAGTCTVTTGVYHGLFSTCSANTFGGIYIYPVGTGGEWEGLTAL